ncbi:MAG: hypothetical protein O2923_08140 [Verrucomicrobia bacterium]|nr:hypothetical protein [Verrucomicrobiota bacterium]MDA1088511.1 hypothetical protein [Verrucomicrobiota bacterium]
MKLPENKKERIQVVALICIGVFGVLYAAIQLGLSPILDDAKKKRERLSDLKDKVSNAERFMEARERHTSDNVRAISNIFYISQSYLLEPEVGNYLLPAKGLVARYTAAAGIPDVSVEEIGQTAIPVSKATEAGESAERAFKAYAVRVSCTGTYSNLVVLTRVIAEENPMLAFGTVQMSTIQKSPQQHHISLVLRWPIWADQSIVEELRAQYEEAVRGGTDADES